MAKRISDETRVEQYFSTADEMSARGTLRVAAAILKTRFPQSEPKKPTRKALASQPKAAQAAAKILSDGPDLEKG